MSSSDEPRFTRRAWLALAGASTAMLWDADAFAIEPEVPVRLQIDLLSRVIPYDRNFAIRVHGELQVAVLVDAGDSDSSRIGNQVLNDLQGRATLASFKQRPTRLTASNVSAVVDECRRRQAGVVYMTPGLRLPVSGLASALQGLGVLTVAAMPEQVRQGAVLGFAVRSGKPRLLVNLTQARRQQVSFRADFLRMAEVVG